MRDFVGASLVFALLVILLFSDRGWVLSDQHRVVSHVADIPRDVPGLQDLPQWVYSGGVHVPVEHGKAVQMILRLTTGQTHLAPVWGDQKIWPALGYGVREWTFLGMPFGYVSELGPSLYTRTPRETVIAGLGEPGMELLQKELGRDPMAGFVYPFWRHLWGWLFVAGVALWGWLYHRSVLRRRAEEGWI